ncbi:hypothetical protein BRD00_07295 [Halobacteriales archaeon QS_8_69_26]|nr:MAG: hypothetical protein BRD00_07295 [Halobacteriales archaeon QS_8_69_26]
MDPKEDVWLEPDPLWTDRYETERERVEEASDDGLLGVFHVGSTAIPDVPGKPTLDVIAVYEDYGSMRAAAEALAEGDHVIEADDEDEESMVVIDWGDEEAVFVKMHTRDDVKVRNQLVFRDYLRENEDARREYERVKREAVEEHGDDHHAYTKAKTDLVMSIIERAHDEGYDDRVPEFA